MKGFAEVKVPDGKLLYVRVEYEELINKVEILGDFFIHPEECLKEIELAVVTLKKDVSREVLIWRIREVVELNKIELIGITPESIADTIREAIK